MVWNERGKKRWDRWREGEGREREGQGEVGWRKGEGSRGEGRRKGKEGAMDLSLLKVLARVHCPLCRAEVSF